MINNSGQVANYVKSVKIICFFSVFHDYVDKSVNEKDFGVKKSRPYKRTGVFDMPNSSILD